MTGVQTCALPIWLTFRVFRRAQPSVATAAALTMTFVLAAAISDEVHQLLTLNRTGSPVDVGYDCAGAVLAAWGLTVRAQKPAK